MALFILALVPRAVYPVSRPFQWYYRSAEFFQAVLRGDWSGTLFTEHPGVTVMWLSGASLWAWYAVQTIAGTSPPAPLETHGYAFADRMQVGILPLAVTIALGIVGGWYLLRKLFGSRMAWVSSTLWAMNPYFLANSELLHLNALLSVLMMLSALLMLVFVRERRPRQLLASAVLGGLAMLTKAPSIYLLPFLALTLAIGTVKSLKSCLGEGGSGAVGELGHRTADCRRGKLLVGLSAALRDGLIWTSVAACVFMVLWPSMWVQPGHTLAFIFDNVFRHASQPHKNPLLYRGVLGIQTLGPRFYLDVLAYRLTFLTLPMALLSVPAMACADRVKRRSLLLVALYGLFYFAQMSLGGHKDGQYLLPVFLPIDVLAAAGLVWWTKRISMSRRAGTLLLGILLAGQAGAVLSRHPYYGTHYNLLLGGPQAAKQVFPPGDFGEGVDIVGQYIDKLEAPRSLVVGTQVPANNMLEQHTRAQVQDVSQVGDRTDLLVFAVQYTMRGANNSHWGSAWDDLYKFREPEVEVRFDGIPYAWLHRTETPPIASESADVHLSEAIRLVGYRLAEPEVSPGESVLLTLYWVADQRVRGDYTVFTHLTAHNGDLLAQQDNPPVRGSLPTSSWLPGDLVEDMYELVVPRGAAFGNYDVVVGMYELETLARLPASDASGERLPDDRVILDAVRVRSPVPWWHWAISSVWMLLVAAVVALPQVRDAAGQAKRRRSPEGD